MDKNKAFEKIRHRAVLFVVESFGSPRRDEYLNIGKRYLALLTHFEDNKIGDEYNIKTDYVNSELNELEVLVQPFMKKSVN